MKIKNLVILLSCCFLVLSSSAQEAKKSSAIHGVNATPQTTTPSNETTANSHYDEQGRLVLSTVTNKSQVLSKTQQLSSTPNHNVSNASVIVKSETELKEDIMLLENQISSIKSDPIAYDLALKTGKLKQLEIDLLNTQTLLNKVK